MGYQNFFATKLFTDIGAADTIITLETAPTATAGRLVIEARNSTQREIIKYTGVSGNQITGVLRGQGGTTAKSHLKNALTEMNATGEDLQDLYDAFSSFSATNGSGWYPLLIAPTTVTNLGQRSYQLTFPGVDYTDRINPGTRLRTTRSVAAPVQSTLLNGTNQYWNKTSPSKLTFTNNFVIDAYVKLTSYAPSGVVIASRFNGTNGFRFTVAGDGSLTMEGYNGGSGNIRYTQSYQAITLNKWVRVTAQLDMSSVTVSPTTSYLMIDGVDAPAMYNSVGTNPTSLVQAGNLEIGSNNGGASLFTGQIAQLAIFNAKVTQTQMRSYHSQGYTGTEVSLASAYSFNGVATDLSTGTPNNLTAQNAAGYTPDSPFGTQASGLISSTVDYAIVSAATFSTNTVVTVQVPEGCTIPTSGGVSAVSYSGIKVPYGFPSKISAWMLMSSDLSGINVPVTGGSIYNIRSLRLVIPVGAWKLSYGTSFFADLPSGAVVTSFLSYTAASNAGISNALSSISYNQSGSGLISKHTGSDGISLSSSASVYLNGHSNNSGTGLRNYITTVGGLVQGGGVIWVENGYL